MPASDYARIADAISFLVASHPDTPDLETLAARVGLSPFHFQRLFARYVGVSPKRFAQHLFLEDARARLSAGASVLETTVEAGLSSPGRLHDLFISLTSMSPGDYKTGAAGLSIVYGWGDSPFGPLLLAQTERGLCFAAFGESPSETEADMQRRYPRASFTRDDAALEPLRERILRPDATGELLRLHLRGTAFQVQVWQALLRVPEGAFTTYGALARAIGRPSACRAVGQAVGANPIAWVIPCHRVIRESGALGGYHWGTPRKQALLAWEGARRVSEAVSA